MTELVIRDEQLAGRLLEIAQRENRSVEVVLDSLLGQYASASESEPKPGSFARLAASAQEAGFQSEPTDTSERSREILAEEYADYLKRRANE